MSAADSTGTTAPTPRSPEAIRDWIIAHVAERLQITPAEIRTDEPLIDLGLDSMEFVALVGELEQWLGVRFRDNPIIDYPTLDSLSAFLADQIARGKTVIDPNDRDA